MVASSLSAHSLYALHEHFITILPRIETHAAIVFRYESCPGQRADCVAETIALAWKWFRRLAERGKDATQFASTLATFAARAVRNGRRVGVQEKAKDALSRQAQRQHGFVCQRIPDLSSTFSDNPLAEALHDNTRTAPPDAAAFRLDWPAWLKTRTRRDRRVIHDLAVGNRTSQVAAKYGLSASRVSQLRRDFHDDWSLFTA